MLERIDLSKATLDDLAMIQNEVLRTIAFQLARAGGGFAAGHDSHSSSHSKNSVLARPGTIESSPSEPLIGRP